MARLTLNPITSMLKIGRGGIRFGSPEENPLLQNLKEFEKDNIAQRSSGLMYMMT